MFRTQSKSRPAAQWLGVLLQTTLLAAPAVWAAPSTSPQNVNVVNTPSVNANVTGGSVSVSGSVNASVGGNVGITNTAGNPVPVHVMVPSAPFSADPLFFYGNVEKAVGTGEPNKLAVTAITIANFNSEAQNVAIQSVSTDSDNCTGTISAESGALYVIVEPHHTLHLTYPTPVVHPAGCVSFEVTSPLSGNPVTVGVYGFSVAP